MMIVHSYMILSLVLFVHVLNSHTMTTSFTTIPMKLLSSSTTTIASRSNTIQRSLLPLYCHPLKRRRSSFIVFSSSSPSSVSINDESILSLPTSSVKRDDERIEMKIGAENNYKLLESTDDSNRIDHSINVTTTKQQQYDDNDNDNDYDQDLQDDESESLLQQTLLQWFQGDFDNYNQVINDRKHGLLPKEGGGHEHIHCTLVPVPILKIRNNSTTTGNKVIAARLAAFYFDGIPTAVFRFRYYQLVIVDTSTCTDKNTNANTTDVVIDTILYTLHPKLEKLLRQQSNNPIVWASIFNSFPVSITNAALVVVEDNSTSSNNSKTIQQVDCNVNNDNRIRLLPKCDVRWSFTIDPIQHSYAIEYNTKKQQQQSSSSSSSIHTNETNSSILNNGIHAIMVYGNATIDSQMQPGSKIFILDQLSLWSNQLWIHDRGFDIHTMNYIYGNQNNIPYILHRVSNFIPTSTRTSTTSTNNVSTGGTLSTNEQVQVQQQQQQQHLYQREIINNDLQWTLGTEYRTEELYNEKIYAMGGPSINIPSMRKPTTSASTGTTTGTSTGIS